MCSREGLPEFGPNMPTYPKPVCVTGRRVVGSDLSVLQSGGKMLHNELERGRGQRRAKTYVTVAQAETENWIMGFISKRQRFLS